MSLTRSFSTSPLGRPRVERRAASCRFKLLSDTVSSSYRCSVPIPARARASTQKPPTPPTPKTATLAAARRASGSSPMSMRVRMNGSDIGKSSLCCVQMVSE